MKRVCQIAKECNINPEHIRAITRKEYMSMTEDKMLDSKQEDKIHQILYFEGKITEITLESKMNYE